MIHEECSEYWLIEKRDDILTKTVIRKFSGHARLGSHLLHAFRLRVSVHSYPVCCLEAPVLKLEILPGVSKLSQVLVLTLNYIQWSYFLFFVSPSEFCHHFMLLSLLGFIGFLFCFVFAHTAHHSFKFSLLPKT